MASAFSIGRVGMLLRRDGVYGYRSALVAMASAAGVVLLLSLIDMIGTHTDWAGFYTKVFGVLLFAGGFIYTSLIFKELHNGASSTLYLTLPASSVEKLVGKALLTTVGYAVATLVFATAVSALSEGVNWLIVSEHHNLFNPVNLGVLRLIAYYVVIQSVFLLGSASYRKLAFVKTAGVVSLLSLALIVLGFLGAVALLGDYLTVTRTGRGLSFALNPEMNRVINSLADGTIPPPPGLRALTSAVKVAFWAAVAPVCWVISWLKIREKEV